MEFHLQEKCPKTLHACAYESLGCKDKVFFSNNVKKNVKWERFEIILYIF